MFMRPSTLAVAIVIALSAAAATTQVLAADETGGAAAACSGDLVPALEGNSGAPDSIRIVAQVGRQAALVR